MSLMIQRLITDAEIHAAFPLMLELRPRLAGTDFLAAIRLQERDGYQLIGGFDECGDLVTLAGYRLTRNLSRGPHLFVDDLVTAAAAQKRGHGRRMIAWLGSAAIAAGVPVIWLDARATARTFYEQCGFEMNTASPCHIDARQASLL